MAKSKAETNGAVAGSTTGDDGLPEGWTACRMDDAGNWATGGTPSRKVDTYFDGTISWIKSGDLNDGVVNSTEETISQQGLDASAAKLLPKGTLSIALYGATIGKLGMFDIEAATNQACTNCVVDDQNFKPWYLFYYLLSQRRFLIQAGQGGAQPNLTNKIIRDWPLPPLAEQKRIVAKVEALLERVSKASERLARVPDLLRRFRQSVLAAACSGQLTADWRGENDGVAESHLLDEFHRNRRSAWESAQLQKLRKKGTLPKSDKWKARYKVPEYPVLELPKRPTGWEWIPLGLLGENPLNAIQTGPFGAMLHRDEFTESGVPVIAVGNLTGMGFTQEGLYFITEDKAEELKRFDVRLGDLLFARSGATLGKVCVAPEFINDWRMIGHILRERLNTDLVLPEYTVFALHGDPFVVAQVMGNVRGVTRPGFNTSLLESIHLPLPPLDKQREIMRRVKALFEIANKIEQRISTATNQTEKITQSILAKAFAGELVETEANLAHREARDYEPASVLLERIAAERVAAGNGKPKRAKNTKPKQPSKTRKAVR